jgi:putative drug exporter of the RND superfamily
LNVQGLAPKAASSHPSHESPRLLRYGRRIVGPRPKWVVLGVWALLIGVGGSLAAGLGSIENNDAETWLPANAQSTQALALAERYFGTMHLSDAVVVYARQSGLTSADYIKMEQDRVTLAADRVATGPISAVTIAADRDAAFIIVSLFASKNNNAVLGGEVGRLRTITQRAAPNGLVIKITGAAGDIADYINIYSGLDTRLLGATLAVVAVVLLLTYRSPMLWLIPLLSVALSSEVASGLVYVLGKYAGLLVNADSAYILTVLTLGVGTDYALLVIGRYREELHRYDDRHEAMAQALRRCLPAIAATAATVAIAMLCLAFGSMNSTRSLGPVVAVGVGVVFLAMTTLLPAVLVTLGRWVFWPFIPRVSTPDVHAEKGGENKVWANVARIVDRSPRLIWIATAVTLLVLSVGSVTLSFGQTQAQQFTKPVDSVAGQMLLAEHFPAGSSGPVDVYVPEGGVAVALASISRVPGVTSASTAGRSGTWTHIAVVLNSAPDTQTAQETVQGIRASLERSDQPAGSSVVGGESAVALDTATAEAHEEKLLIPLVLDVVLIMLVLLLRALIGPVILIGAALLSYAAAVGTASLLYNALGYRHIDLGLLLFGFVFLVALGVDYTVFLMTRVREEVGRLGHRRGVLAGLTRTGGVITAAGLVLAASFSVLVVIPTVGSLQQGLLVAVGVLIDTFIVRSVLIPALALDIGGGFWRPGHPDGLSHGAAEPR